MITIDIVTAGRSDYSILYPLIKSINRDKVIDFNLIITGNHFDKKFGESINEIKVISKKIFKIKYSYQNSNISNYCADIISRSHNIFKKTKPNYLLVLGDRYEIISITLAGYYNNIPIIHLHGGEISLGSLDNYIRDAISKLSSIHFVSNLKSKKNLINMNEKEKYIFNVGSLGIESMLQNKFYNKNFLTKNFNLNFSKKNILVTYHPNTKNSSDTKNEIDQIILALVNIINKFKDAITIIFTSPNADQNYEVVIKKIEIFAKKNYNVYYIPNFGYRFYSSILKNVDCIIGNSSSGIIEAHSLKTYSLNIGDRQKGRYQNSSTFNCDFNYKSIYKSILSIFKINNKLTKKNIYEKKNTSNLILKTIKSLNKININYKNK